MSTATGAVVPRAASLSAAHLVGLGSVDAISVHGSILAGFPYKSIRTFKDASTLKLDSIRSTLALKKKQAARRKEIGRLSPNESDKLYRLATVFEQTVKLFEGDVPAAVKWLNLERTVLGGKTPLEMTATEVGARQVLQLIGRLEDGVFS